MAGEKWMTGSSSRPTENNNQSLKWERNGKIVYKPKFCLLVHDGHDINEPASIALATFHAGHSQRTHGRNLYTFETHLYMWNACTRRMPETQLIRKQTKIMVSASGRQKTKEKLWVRIDESIIHAFSVSKIFISTVAILVQATPTYDSSLLALNGMFITQQVRKASYEGYTRCEFAIRKYWEWAMNPWPIQGRVKLKNVKK